MKKQILDELEELVDAGIISSETSQKIKIYFDHQVTKSKFNVIISVLASIFVGLGIILILNHNWDNFSRSTKTIISYAPLVITIGLSTYALLKKQDDRSWMESSSTLLFFSIGSTIALISQIYNLYPDYIGFVQTWLFLSLPIIFIMKTRSVILLSLALANFYIFLDGTFFFGTEKPYEYLILVVIYTIMVYRNVEHPISITNEVLYSWMISLFVPVNVILFLDGESIYFVMMLINLSTFYILLSKFDVLKWSESSKYAFLLIGNISMHAGLIVCSNPEFFETLFSPAERVVHTHGLNVAIFLMMMNLGLFIYQFLKNRIFNLNSMAFIVYSILFLTLLDNPVLFYALVNLLIIGIGVEFIQKGTSNNSLRRINYGLLLICIVILRMFFDIDLSITVRGILFLVVGLLFYMVNRFLIRNMEASDE